MQATQLPIWIEYVKALGTPLVALVAASIASMIAYRQWATARDKLKLDMFDRRMEIYSTALALMRWGLMIVPDKSDDPIENLAVLKAKSKWLLDSKVEAFLNDLLGRAFDYLHEDTQIESVLPAAKPGIVRGVASERRKQFNKDIAILDNLFEPYLSVKH